MDGCIWISGFAVIILKYLLAGCFWIIVEIPGVYTTRYSVRVVFGPSRVRVGQKNSSTSRVSSTRRALVRIAAVSRKAVHVQMFRCAGLSETLSWILRDETLSWFRERSSSLHHWLASLTVLLFYVYLMLPFSIPHHWLTSFSQDAKQPLTFWDIVSDEQEKCQAMELARKGNAHFLRC